MVGKRRLDLTLRRRWRCSQSYCVLQPWEDQASGSPLWAAFTGSEKITAGSAYSENNAIFLPSLLALFPNHVQ